MIKFSIIVPTFNSERFITGCLDSLFGQDYPDLEVIVVDNGSKDQTRGLVKFYGSKVNLIENNINLGACKARNQAISVSHGEWILTLDSDTLLERGFLSGVGAIISELPSDVGMIQPKILSSDRKTIYSAGIHLSVLRRFFDVGRVQKDSVRFNKPKSIFGCCSAAALYKREMLEEIKEIHGYFDERFFFLVEDVDLSWRARKKNWRALFCPELVCYHYGNSSAISKEARQYLSFRNRKLMIRKNETYLGKVKLDFLGLPYHVARWVYLLGTNKYFIESFYSKYEDWHPGEAA
jgi:GT2 family glycosyltransferase